MLIDLQIHSTYSDGYLSPTQIAEHLKKHKVKIAALTDHNTVGGIGEFKQACKKFGIKAIAGLELYVRLGSRNFSVLWFNLDYKHPELHNLLRDTQYKRRKKARTALRAMLKMGFRIDVDKVIDKYNHYVPLNHLVDEIMSEPFNVAKAQKELNLRKASETDIINAYVRNKSIGKLTNSFVDIRKLFALREVIGGQIVLGHPGKHNMVNPSVWSRLKTLGLDGVEKLSPHHSFGAVMYIQQISREMDLIETGGSDFHRYEGDSHLVQSSWDYYQVDSRLLRGVSKITG